MDAVGKLSQALAGRYQIEREVGRGGMATVYLARDLRHDRRVALKVLSPELGAVLGTERFLAEIRVTANLQHPNLLPLFDSGEAVPPGQDAGGPGLLFYVMPFVDGESLRARLDREKQLPVDEAIRIGCSVANALDYAHAHGVVHRDLKPENILLQAGQPVVADFGIALAVSNAGGARVTQTGLSLGTPQYMSPEQATGDRVIDGRSDIYSLAAVIYEMLTGEPPHYGATVQAIIARVLTERPHSVRVSRPAVPEHVDLALQRALEKLPADRFARARELGEALEGKMVTVPSGIMTPAGLGSGRPRTRAARLRDAWPWALALGAALGIAGWGWLREPPSAPRVTGRFHLDLPPEARYREAAGVMLAISPDGRDIVYHGVDTLRRDMLFVRSLDATRPRPIPGTEGGGNPSFSPDGRWISFTVGFGGVGARGTGSLKKVAAGGGSPMTLADSSGTQRWGADGWIYFVRRNESTSAIMRVRGTGGSVEQVLPPSKTPGEFYTLPDPLPDGRGVLVTVQQGQQAVESAELAVAPLGGPAELLGQRGTGVRYLPSGHLLWGMADGAVMIAPFDTKSRRLTGDPVRVLEDALVKGGGAMSFAISRDGTLVYAVGSSLNFLEIDGPHGAAIRLEDGRQYGNVRFSPDGGRVAMDVLARERGTFGDIWVYDVASATLTRMTTNGDNHAPEWSPDGRWLLFTTRDTVPGRNDVLRRVRADGSVAPDTAVLMPDQAPPQAHDGVWTPDGRAVVFLASRPRPSAADLWMVALDGDRTPRPLMQTPFAESTPSISPDGRWIAYVSNESGQYEIYVRAFPSMQRRYQITNGGGVEPRWLRDGRTIAYWQNSRLSAAGLEIGDSVTVRERRVLADDPAYVENALHSHYDIHPDGRRRVMVRRSVAAAELYVVVNWLEDAMRKVAAAGATGR